MFYSGRRLPLLILLAFSVACTRNNQRVTPQIAVLRFENLSADPSLDWMGRGFSEIISGELTGMPEQGVIEWPYFHRLMASGVADERTAAILSGATEIVYGHYAAVNGTLRVTAIAEDLASHKMVRTISTHGAPDAIFAMASNLAPQLGAAHAFGTQNSRALESYTAALDAPDQAGASRGFAQAVAADPDFGSAYVMWMDAALAGRNRAEAESVWEQARSRQARFRDLDRAALQLDAAILNGDFAAQLAARRSLARLDPANPNHHRTLAESLMSVRDFAGALVEFRRGLSLRPDDVLALNSMGYAAAYSGDLPTAIRVLRGYEQLRPSEPNPLDSLGDAHFALGHFREAEQFYLAANARSTSFLNGGSLMKAAQARLMTGDVTGATQIFHRYLAARQAAQDPAAPVYAAEWLWATGDHAGAIDAMQKLAPGEPRAATQAALWMLESGDTAGAIAQTHRAAAQANAAGAGIIGLVAYLADPQHAPAPPQPPLNEYARACQLLFAKQFAAATPILERLYAQPTSELDDGLSVLLAWAYAESAQWQKAAPLLRLTPLPQAAGMPIFYSLYFPRIFWLRGQVLEHDARRSEAAAYYALFRKLSGPSPQISN